MYSCGPTVYRYAHVGNLRTFLLPDLIRRALLYHGVEVFHVQNITDVGHLRDERFDRGEDRMLVAAGLEQKTPAEIADAYEAAFHHDAAAMNLLPAHVFPRATEHIADMVALAERLVDLGHAYVTDHDNVYYRVSSFPGYGRLSGNTLDDLRAGHRGHVEHDKEDPADFALWKSAGEGRILSWDTPRWGRGFPGWHIECSAMSLAHLGSEFDIHTGGVDHIPVHHTNEIAQSEAYLGDGRAWVNVWLHNEFINLREAKMSKSKGDTLLLSDLEERGFHALVYRYLLLGSHYRNQTEFTWEGLEGAAVALRRLLERLRVDAQPLTYEEAASRLTATGRGYLDELDEAISTDLGTPQALAVLNRLSRDPDVGDDDRAALAGAFESVLAIGVLDLDLDDVERPVELEVARAEIERLLEARQEARRSRDFAAADEIRERLERSGVEIRDTPDGTVWKARPARGRATE
jgi:cysteinyl-tRNA synthetase